MKPTEYAGSEWLKAARKDIEISPLGIDVADAVGEIWKGIYHLPNCAIHKGSWDNPHCIFFNVRESLSTFDFDTLTRLVFIAHDRCLRLEIQPSGPGLLRLLWHRRKRDQMDMARHHPAIEDALNWWRRNHEAPDCESFEANALREAKGL